MVCVLKETLELFVFNQVEGLVVSHHPFNQEFLKYLLIERNLQRSQRAKDFISRRGLQNPRPACEMQRGWSWMLFPTCRGMQTPLPSQDVSYQRQYRVHPVLVALNVPSHTGDASAGPDAEDVRQDLRYVRHETNLQEKIIRTVDTVFLGPFNRDDLGSAMKTLVMFVSIIAGDAVFIEVHALVELVDYVASPGSTSSILYINS
jgi:hypothetical protein